MGDSYQLQCGPDELGGLGNEQGALEPDERVLPCPDTSEVERHEAVNGLLFLIIPQDVFLLTRKRRIRAAFVLGSILTTRPPGGESGLFPNLRRFYRQNCAVRTFNPIGRSCSSAVWAVNESAAGDSA